MKDIILLAYALQFVGLPYKWGGDDTLKGYDCSGLVQEILASVDQDPPGDQTAQMLFDHFSKNGVYNSSGLGALAFFGKDEDHISHVGFCLDNHRMIEAGGGGSDTLTEEDAAEQNAYVRIRQISRRKDLVAVIKPHYRECCE